MNGQETEIRIPFRCRLMVDEAGFSYALDVEGTGFHAGSIGQAKKRLREMIEKNIKHALDAQALDHTLRTMYGTKDGSVFLVEYRYGVWGYSIWGPDRKGHSSTSGWMERKEAEERAERHIESAFGGVAWKCH